MKIVKRKKEDYILFNEIENGCVFRVKGNPEFVLMKMKTRANAYGPRTNAVDLEFGELFLVEENVEVVPIDCELVIMTKEM